MQPEAHILVARNKTFLPLLIPTTNYVMLTNSGSVLKYLPKPLEIPTIFLKLLFNGLVYVQIDVYNFFSSVAIDIDSCCVIITQFF